MCTSCALLPCKSHRSCAVAPVPALRTGASASVSITTAAGSPSIALRVVGTAGTAEAARGGLGPAGGRAFRLVQRGASDAAPTQARLVGRRSPAIRSLWRCVLLMLGVPCWRCRSRTRPAATLICRPRQPLPSLQFESGSPGIHEELLSFVRLARAAGRSAAGAPAAAVGTGSLTLTPTEARSAAASDESDPEPKPAGAGGITATAAPGSTSAASTQLAAAEHGGAAAAPPTAAAAAAGALDVQEQGPGSVGAIQGLPSEDDAFRIR